MNQELNARPINHSTISAAGATVAGAGAGAIKSSLYSVAAWFVGLTAVGALVGFAIATGGIGAAGIAGFLTSGGFLGTAIGGIVGLVGAAATWYVPAIAGGGYGAISGGSRAATRVDNERGAATVLQAQVDAFKAQAEAVASAPKYAANDNKYNLPPQGDAMNPASAKINTGADNAQLQGALANAELQRA